MNPRRSVALLALGLLTIGCANPNVPRLDAGDGIAAVTSEEQRWIAEADDIEKQLQEKDAFVSDAGVQGYLDTMMARLVASSGTSGAKFRVRVLRQPLFNAFVLANGLVATDVGYLGLIDDGAQLAAVLGHEIEHHVDRHRLRSTREWRNQRTVSILAATPLMALGLVNIGAMAANDMAGNLAGRYSREQEKNADLAGLRAALAAGYDVRTAPTLMDNVKAFHDEEAFEGAPVNPSIRSHPPMPERVAALREALATLEAQGADFASARVDREGFERAMAPVFLDGARFFLDRHRLERARALVTRYLAVRPEDAEGWWTSGEIARLSATGKPEALEVAAASYRRATQLDPAMAKAWRDLGLALRGRGKMADSREPLRRYLALDATAVDRPIVEAWLAQ